MYEVVLGLHANRPSKYRPFDYIIFGPQPTFRSTGFFSWDFFQHCLMIWLFLKVALDDESYAHVEVNWTNQRKPPLPTQVTLSYVRLTPGPHMQLVPPLQLHSDRSDPFNSIPTTDCMQSAVGMELRASDMSKCCNSDTDNCYYYWFH